MSILQIQAQHISSVFSLPTIVLWKLFINPFKVLFFCFFFTSLGLLFSFTPFDFIKKNIMHNVFCAFKSKNTNIEWQCSYDNGEWLSYAKSEFICKQNILWKCSHTVAKCCHCRSQFSSRRALTAIHQSRLLFTSVSSLEPPTSPTAQWPDSC